jgi:gas vesicle protein
MSTEGKGRTTRTVGAAAAGAVAAYLFDPDRGRERRAKARDQIAAFLRRRGGRVQKAARHAAGELRGEAHRVAHPRSSEEVPPNDQALAAKVESEVLGDFPKGKIAVNSEGGIVFLRGELDSSGAISEVEQAVRKVTGVLDVQNLLHLPGELAPNKKAGVEASHR